MKCAPLIIRPRLSEVGVNWTEALRISLLVQLLIHKENAEIDRKKNPGLWHAVTSYVPDWQTKPVCSIQSVLVIGEYWDFADSPLNMRGEILTKFLGGSGGQRGWGQGWGIFRSLSKMVVFWVCAWTLARLTSKLNQILSCPQINLIKMVSLGGHCKRTGYMSLILWTNLHWPLSQPYCDLEQPVHCSD